MNRAGRHDPARDLIGSPDFPVMAGTAIHGFLFGTNLVWARSPKVVDGRSGHDGVLHAARPMPT